MYLRNCDTELFSESNGKRNAVCISGRERDYDHGRIPDSAGGRLDSADPKDVELLVIPGGDIEKIDTPEVWKYLKSVHDLGGRIAAICAGVDVVEHAGLLEGIESTHSGEKDVVTSDRITTSRANGYVDFAIEVAKQLELFEDEADLQETIAFWREFRRIESN